MESNVQEQLDGGHIKGLLVKAHVDWLKSRRGESGFEAVVERLSGASTEALRRPVSVAEWYAFRTLIELDRAIAAIEGGDLRAVVAELGRHSARENVEKAYRLYDRPSPQSFFQETARLHTRYQDFGRVIHTPSGRTSCRIDIVESSCFSQLYCWSAAGFYEEATRLTGGNRPFVRESSCRTAGRDCCTFEVRWANT